MITGAYGSGKRRFARFLKRILSAKGEQKIELFIPSNTQMN